LAFLEILQQAQDMMDGLCLPPMRLDQQMPDQGINAAAPAQASIDGNNLHSLPPCLEIPILSERPVVNQ
jgi:hypothetical protein